ncbi:MAG: hypothetical protein ORN85_10340 [Sediminibacterium sp.]|nr:hypothetical protein [Sediminibacterium sp.]
MKRPLIYLIIILLIIVIGGYIYLPKQLTISSAGILKTPYFGILRNIQDTQIFKTLGFINSNKNESIKLSYKLENINYDGSHFVINSPYSQTPLNGSIIEFRNDSSLIYLSQQYSKTYQPLKVFYNYFKAVHEKQKQEQLIDSFELYLNNLEYLYGIKPQFDTVRYTEFISDNTEFNTRPTTAQIYQLINPLQQYILNNKIKILTPPMLNLRALENNKYFVQVAFGIDTLKISPFRYKPKKMIKGNLLTATVKGDYLAVDKSLQSLEKFIRDSKMSSPAIHFQYLISNRLEQTDSSQWITIINYPIY